MKRHFYENALPHQGVYCVAAIDKNGIKSRFADTLDELVELIEKLKGWNSNVYVTPHTFRGYSRVAKDAVFCRSMYIDLDVAQDNANKYPSQSTALEALGDFISEQDLPTPVVVNSGTGIQAYWIFEEEVSSLEWKPVAEGFKQFCFDKGLKIDPAVTADAARLMRCPDTFNYKTEPPSPTSIINPEDIVKHSFADFKTRFVGLTDQVLKEVSDSIDDDTRAVAAAFPKVNPALETSFVDIVNKSLAGEGCNQIRMMVIQPNEVSYNLWMAGLSVAARCSDAEDSIHDLSSGYKNYDRQATIDKAAETLKATGPWFCTSFEKENPAGCIDCPFKGQLVPASPIALGKRVKELPKPEPSSGLPEFPEFLRPYSWGIDGGIYYTPPPVRDKKGKIQQDDPVLVCRNIFFPTNRMYSAAGEGEVLSVKALLPRDPEREFDLPLSSVSSLDRFKELMSKNGVVPSDVKNNNLYYRMADYMSRWSEHLMTLQPADIMRMQMGWTDDMQGFVIGHREIRADGNVTRSAASSAVKVVAKFLDAHGSYEVWKKSANALNQPSLELLAFGALCGFGSPLMTFTNTPGISVCYTGQTGIGKSAALYAGVSIFGQPRGLTTQQNGATGNGLVGRYLNLKNLLFGIDEVHTFKADEVSNISFSISTGKPKIRMQASTNAERPVEAGASLISVWNSNSDVVDLVQSNKKNPEGEVSRIVQFMMRKPELFIQQPELGREIIEPFNSNYGHAGIEYIQEIFRVGSAHVEERLEYWGKRFDMSFGTDTSYRFYRSLISATFTGGEIANQAGIIDYDLDRIYKIVVAEMLSYRDKTNNNTADYPEILNEFLTANNHLFLKMEGSVVKDEPFHKVIIGRKELDKQLIYVSKTALKKFFADKKINSSQFEHDMRERGVLLRSEKKRLGAGWSLGSDVGAVNVYVFKMDVAELKDV